MQTKVLLSRILIKTKKHLDSSCVTKFEISLIRKSYFSSSSVLNRFYESNPKGSYYDPKIKEKIDREVRENLYGAKDGFKDLREQIIKWKDEWKERLTNDTRQFVVHGDREIIWKFDNPEFKKTWVATADSQNNEGYSKSELTMSPTGKALFRGFVNTKVPTDGRIKKAGYCAMRCHRITKSFHRESYLSFEPYSHLIMRVRGDGRHYLINLSTAGYFDITWNDMYQYVLYTRGGPYWQFVKIPFSKFFFGSKGRTQDFQSRIPLSRIAHFGIAVGRIDGPFNLEIDYIGLELDRRDKEETAYETYKVPEFIAGV